MISLIAAGEASMLSIVPRSHSRETMRAVRSVPVIDITSAMTRARWNPPIGAPVEPIAVFEGDGAAERLLALEGEARQPGLQGAAGIAGEETGGVRVGAVGDELRRRRPAHRAHQPGFEVRAQDEDAPHVAAGERGLAVAHGRDRADREIGRGGERGDQGAGVLRRRFDDDRERHLAGVGARGRSRTR